jgi:hypothetical protein
VERVVQTLEETLAEVHIANWVNRLCEDDTTRKLTIAVAPVVLNTFEMPLVNKNNNFLTF